MTYRIEITADSLTELSGKVLAIAAQLHATPADPVMPEVREAAKPKRAKAEKPVEVAAEPQPEPQPGPQPEPEAPVELDFDKDVAPVVLAAIAAHGKPWVQEILSQFGAERASLVPVEQWGELVSVLAAGQ